MEQAAASQLSAGTLGGARSVGLASNKQPQAPPERPEERLPTPSRQPALPSPSGTSPGLSSPGESGTAHPPWAWHAANGAVLAPSVTPSPTNLPSISTGDPQVHLWRAALSFHSIPAIFKRRRIGSPDVLQELGVQVADWNDVRRARMEGTPQRTTSDSGSDLRSEGAAAAIARQAVHKMSKVARAKGCATSRTYTSKYRGVHQTFPTKRWEAQFRRNGKPTSLGCFDHEEEAARAYDKMMLWCELHAAAGVKGGITNFDPAEYEKDLPWLQGVEQDELVQALRSDGRRQAAQRMLRQKRDGASADGEEEEGEEDEEAPYPEEV